MRTEPPTGDELARMLATMRGEVMRTALQDASEPASGRVERPARDRGRGRGRVVAIAIALVSLLVVGGTGAALAAGIIPNPFGEPPAPAPAVTVTVTATPTPTPTLTPTPAEPVPVPDVPVASDDRVEGYSARAAWDACLAAGLAVYGEFYTPSAEYSATAVSPPTAVGQKGVVVRVPATVPYQGEAVASAWFCGVEGDVDDPTVVWTDVVDK